MYILAIDTSCDETSVAITKGRKVISHIEYSQVQTHKQWGGVVPSVAKRAHMERIKPTINLCIKRAQRQIRGFTEKSIDAVAVTVGPGLAIALEVGITAAKELATQLGVPLIPINHMEGHIYSCFAQNAKGNPSRDIALPLLTVLVSGGHTELVYIKESDKYQIIGKTRDDAAGEALDKGARLLGLGYPGGAALERLARDAKHTDMFQFPRPMMHSKDLDFSFSGLKTSFRYFLENRTEKENLHDIAELANSYQEAVFEVLVAKTEKAILQFPAKTVAIGGGVVANQRLKALMRTMLRNHNRVLFTPPYAYLNGDNAAMIGVAAHFAASKNRYVKNFDLLDRVPRLSLENALKLQ